MMKSTALPQQQTILLSGPQSRSSAVSYYFKTIKEGKTIIKRKQGGNGDEDLNT